MSLKFDKIKPVEFGDFAAMPQLTTEIKLRAQNLKFGTDDQLEQAKDVLASAFGDDKSRVRQFMDENFMGAYALQELQSYLLGGENMLENYRRQIERAVEKKMDKAMEGVDL